MKTKWSMIAVLGLASVLTVADLAQAQVRISVGIGPRVSYPSRPYHSSPYYGPPRYYYGGPSVVYSPSVVVQSRPIVVVPNDPAPIIASSSPANGATIRVLVPDPNAQVFFDGSPTRQVGTDRTFHTPPLAAGAPNTYRIRASFNGPAGPMVQEQVVPVTPGQTVVVDFTRTAPPSEGLPLPK